MSKNNEINDGYWLRGYAINNGIPADCQYAYRIIFNKSVSHFKTIIDDIIKKNGGSVELPMQPYYIEQYLSGYTIEYQPIGYLDEVEDRVEGFWRIDPEYPDHITIYYNQRATTQRQRYTQIHELLHFVQTIDPPFMKFFDGLIENSTLPASVIVKLLDRITERATAMYLMPNTFFLNKYREIESRHSMFGDAQIKELANAFDVSVQSTKYRMNECLRHLAM